MLKNAIAIEVEVFTFDEFQSRKTQVMLWNNNSMIISETNWKQLNKNKSYNKLIIKQNNKHTYKK